MAKLSDAMQAALYTLYNTGESGKAKTMEALDKRGMIFYSNSGQRVISAAGREAIEAPNSLIGEQSGGVVLYGSVVAYDRVQGEEHRVEVSEPQEASESQEAPTPDVDAEWADYTETTRAWAADSANDLPEEAPTCVDYSLYQDGWTDREKAVAGFGATLLFRDTHVWDGLTAKEIKADIKTAWPIGRAGRRGSVKIARKLTNELFKSA